MEYVWHVDEKDNVIGKVERKEAHEKKLFHRAGVVLVFNSRGQVYLTKRSLQKKIFPGVFDAACSFHVTYGETYGEAAKRELYEETKITRQPKCIGKAMTNYGPDFMIFSVFTVQSEKVELDSSEATNGEFYDIEEAGRIMAEEKTTSWLCEAWKVYTEGIARSGSK